MIGLSTGLRILWTFQFVPVGPKLWRKIQNECCMNFCRMYIFIYLFLTSFQCWVTFVHMESEKTVWRDKITVYTNIHTFHICSYTILKFVIGKIKESNTFIQKGCITLNKSDSKYIYVAQNFNFKWCFDFSINSRILEKKILRLLHRMNLLQIISK